VPFDLPEAETELVAGFHTEYSGMKFAFFFLAEYINMITVSAIAVTMFLGGWLPPFHSLLTHEIAPGVRAPHAWAAGLFSAPAGFLFMAVKIALLYYVYFWLRATLPRYRYDQLMALGWKWLIPVAMANVFLVGVDVVLHSMLGLGNWFYLVLAAANVLIILVVVYFARGDKERKGNEAKQAFGHAY
jgi:NADH-quinone oxidoreductase subunit H